MRYSLFKSHISYCIAGEQCSRLLFGLSTHMTMLDTMLHVHECVPINNKH